MYIAPPNLDTPELKSAPDARFAAAPAGGVFPDHFFSTTNLPTYVKVKGKWTTPREAPIDVKALHAKIGQQALELDFLANALGRGPGPSGKR